jgi:hypothetical protein
MKITVRAVDVTLRVDFRTLTPIDSDISRITVASFVLEDRDDTLTAAQLPKEFDEVLIDDDDNVTLLFGGYVNTIVALDKKLTPAGRAWQISVQDYASRLLQTATGSLDKSAVTDTDRNFVIAILRNALKAQSFDSGTIDDAIVTANEPNWPGVQFTAFLAGLDWSYTPTSSAIARLIALVPNVFLSIGPDKIVNYGLRRAAAAFGVSSAPDGVTLFAFENYTEEVVISGHVNKMRRGGAAASEVTAIDETSFARYGRIFDAGYVNDTTILATDLARRAYAELRTRRVKRRAKFRVRQKGLVAGTVIDTVVSRLGSGTRPATMAIMGPALARSSSGALAGERNRWLITKVKTIPTGNRTYAYDVEVGDVQDDFALQVPAVVAH